MFQPKTLIQNFLHQVHVLVLIGEKKCYLGIMRRYGTLQNYIATYYFGPNQVQQYPSSGLYQFFPLELYYLPGRVLTLKGRELHKEFSLLAFCLFLNLAYICDINIYRHKTNCFLIMFCIKMHSVLQRKYQAMLSIF